MLNSRQRAQLRSMANNYDTLFQIGKGGISETLIKQVEDALYVRELIKVRVLETAPITVREAADTVAQAVDGDVVQVIGSKFVLYKKSINKELKNPIVLVK